jgi:hypothetical protein
MFVMQGKMLEEEQFNVSLPQILEMIFLDVNLYIAVFWAGDQEFCDKGTFVHIHISTCVRFVPVYAFPGLHKCTIGKVKDCKSFEFICILNQLRVGLVKNRLDRAVTNGETV